MFDLARSTLLIGENPASLARIAASIVVTSIVESLENNSYFDLVLSGGDTPKPLFDFLAKEHRRTADWSRARFFWGDERNVAPDHPESNYRMAKEHLLDPLGIRPEQIFRIRPEIGTAAEAAQDYEKRLRDLKGDRPCFGVNLLGLGEDGHTASLFPDAWSDWMEDEKRGRWVSAPWIPHLRAHRITLLPHVLNASSRVLFLVSGAKKSRILREVLNFNPDQDEPRYPAQLIRPVPDIYGNPRKALWLVDRAAASELCQAA